MRKFILSEVALGEEVQKRIQSSGLSDSVTIYDYVDDISEMYDHASVFCRPSLLRGTTLTMLEAMASGVPPVVTAIAGVPEVVTDHETGILLEPGNPDEVAQAVIELFDDAGLRARLATNAREYITENLTWSSGHSGYQVCIGLSSKT